MSIFTERQQRDDMYALARQGSVDTGIIEGKRIGKLDGPHIFLDGGQMLPVSLLKARNNRKIGLFKSGTFRFGPPHSHDADHLFHILESLQDAPATAIRKFRKRVNVYRTERKIKRDR